MKRPSACHRLGRLFISLENFFAVDCLLCSFSANLLTKNEETRTSLISSEDNSLGLQTAVAYAQSRASAALN
jgi:hypothetical protein